MTQPETTPGEWLTMAKAMARTGWHLQRLQSRARREEWPRRRPNKGPMEYLVPASLLAMAEDGHDDAADDGMAMSAADLYAELSEERAARIEAVERAAHAEGRAAKAEGRAEVLQAALDREVVITAELRRELAEARRPLVLRILDGLRRR